MTRKQDKKLTQKQENFVLKYFECGNASEAYRHAYNASKMKDETINNKAYQILNKGEIRARLNKLQSKAEEKSQWNIQKLIKAHTRLFEIGIGDVASSRIVTEGAGYGITRIKEAKMRDTNLSSAIRSLVEIGKLLGYYSNKLEQENELSIKDFAKQFYEEKREDA